MGVSIDTGSLQDKFTLQIPGAMAEFEHSLIRELTKAGVKATKALGWLPTTRGAFSDGNTVTPMGGSPACHWKPLGLSPSCMRPAKPRHSLREHTSQQCENLPLNQEIVVYFSF